MVVAVERVGAGLPRPQKLTKARREVIRQALLDGLTVKDASKLAGISDTTFYNWRRAHPDFDQMIEETIAERARILLLKIAEAGPKDWRAYADVLDRVAPQYRKTSNLEVSGPGGGPIVVEDARHVLLERIAQAAERLAGTGDE